MQVIKSVKEMQAFSERCRAEGKTIGFVPTMGCLHQGHLSLLEASKKQCDLTVASIYVNPTQFGPKEDFHNYPRDFEGDKKLCQKAGVDAVFHPSDREMQRPGAMTVEVGELAKKLCGQSRPTHFQGVATVCARLFNIVKPHKAFFGLKDFQQYVVVKKMVEDLDFGLKVIGCQIVREADGLALSSRNRYLNGMERKEAAVLFKALNQAKELFKGGEKNPAKVKAAMRETLNKTSARIDYIEIVNPETLEEVLEISQGDVALLAAFFRKARLIDNLVLE